VGEPISISAGTEDGGGRTSVSPDAGGRIYDGAAGLSDSTVPLEAETPPDDAAADGNVGGGDDGGLLAACVADNVFYLDIIGAGQFIAGGQTYDNPVAWYDFGNIVIEPTNAPFYGLNIQETDNWKMQPGEFTLGTGVGVSAPLVQVATNESTGGCYSTDGSIDIVQVETVATPGSVGDGEVVSLVASFDVFGCVLPAGDTQEFRGCVRYQSQ
jgi:hypothetical protein